MKMKHKRKLFTIFLLFFLLFQFAVPSFAIDASGESENTRNAFSELYNELSPEIKEELSKIGLENANYEELLKLSPKRIFAEFLNLILGKMTEPLKALGLLCGVMLLASIADAFIHSDSAVQNIFSIFTSLFALLCILNPISASITAAFSSMQVSSAFLFSYIPIFSSVLLLNGKMLASGTYSSMMLLLSNLLGVLNTKLFYPLVECILLLNISSAIQDKYTFKGIADFIKKAITVILAFFSTIFSGLLAIKGNLALAGDSVAMRGVKLIIGTAVPVVGGSLSEACSSILGSLALMKGALGFLGVLVIAVIHLPAILDLFLWNLALSFSSAVADALGQKQIKTLLDGFASTISLVNTMLIFTVFLLIVSTGILLRFKD